MTRNDIEWHMTFDEIQGVEASTTLSFLLPPPHLVAFAYLSPTILSNSPE